MKILILGHEGMLGNVVYKYMSKKYDVETINNYRWNSIEFKNDVLYSEANYIINCIGAIPQKKYSKEYYEFLNVELPIFLGKTGKKIIHPSTDCEFSGNLPYPQKYKKNDVRDADDDYGKSKAKINKMIVDDFYNTKIIRTSIIGHEIKAHVSLLDWFLSVPDGQEVNGYANYFWNGVTTLEWAKIAELIMLDWNNYDIMTQIGCEGMNKFELLVLINKVYEKSVTIKEFNMKTTLNKMLESDFEIPTMENQLFELKNFYNK